MWSYGELPYKDWDDPKILSELQDDYRFALSSPLLPPCVMFVADWGVPADARSSCTA